MFFIFLFIDEVVNVIYNEKFDLVFVFYVEMVFGIILFDGYLKVIGEVVYFVGGLFVLDCIVFGIIWVDM